jgi:hypothetical protein
VVAPGAYTIRLAAADVQPLTATLIVRGDPRVSISDEDRRERDAAALRAYEGQKTGIPANNRAGALNTQMTSVVKAIAAVEGAPADVKTAADDLAKKIREVQGRLSRAMQQVNGAARELGASTSRPTELQLQQLASALSQLDRAVPELAALTASDVPAFNQKLDAARLPASVPRLRVE